MVQNNIKSLVEKCNSTFLLYLVSRSLIGVVCIVISGYLMNCSFWGRDVISLLCIGFATTPLTKVFCYVNTYIRSRPIALLMYRVEMIVKKIRKDDSMPDEKVQSIVLTSCVDSLRDEMDNLNLSEQEIGACLSSELLNRIHIRTLLYIYFISALVISVLSSNELAHIIWVIPFFAKDSLDTTNAVILLKAVDYPQKLKNEFKVWRKMGYCIVYARLPRRKNCIRQFIEELFLPKRSTDTYSKYLRYLSVIPKKATLVRHRNDYLIYQYKWIKKK